MLVVALVADVHADVVQDSRVFQPFAFAIGQAVDRARLIEQADGETGHVLGMFRPVVAALGELEHAAPTDVRVAIGLNDFLAMPCDVVEDQSFTQRQVAQGQFVCAEAAQDFVEKDRAGNREIGASRLESRHAKPLLEIERHQILADAANLLGREAPVSQGRAGRESLGRRRHGPDAEDGSRRANHSLEAIARNLVKVFSNLRVDVPNELPLLARFERI